MHPVFRVPELVALIVQNAVIPARNLNLLPRPGRQRQTLTLDRDSRRDLISLGLTSTVFLDHVLNVMWHTQFDFIRLFRLVGAVEEHGGPGGASVSTTSFP